MQFYLFCKSYAGDLLRVKNLWSSIQRFNKDNIAFYLSIPSCDLELFKNHIIDKTGLLNWLTDEEIISAGSPHGIEYYRTWDGRLSQQVIKSEFWRWIKLHRNKSDVTYLCLDSECIFLRDFYISDFFYSETVPYTVMHQNKELLQLANNKKIVKIANNLQKENEDFKKIFNRSGVRYEFGPTPVIWSSKVWEDLYDEYLCPSGLSIWEAIKLHPSELRWYGESLLYFRSIDLMPIEPIFRVYHYSWQYFHLRKSGESLESLSKNYIGVLYQSNWDYSYDYGAQLNRKSIISRLLRYIKLQLSRFK